MSGRNVVNDSALGLAPGAPSCQLLPCFSLGIYKVKVTQLLMNSWSYIIGNLVCGIFSIRPI